MNRLVSRCLYVAYLLLLWSSPSLATTPFVETTTISSAIPVVATTAAATGEIMWRDDFDGNQLNTNYWGYDLGGGGWGNYELQTYTTGAVSVSGGLLNIRAERISTGFTSGRIKSDNKVMFQYGTVEARIKVPDSDAGLWPAFWTMGMNFEDVGWPRSGEIDIMEIGQGLAITEGVVNRRVISGAHWEFEDNLAAYALWKTFNVDLNLDFHIYRLDWTPTSLITYVDGVKVWEMDIDAANCVDCEEFHQPHFLVLNLAVGGLFTSTGGSGSSSSASSSSTACSSAASSSSSSGGCGEPRIDVSSPLPADMQVDFVHIRNNGFTQLFAPTPAPTRAPTAPPTPTMDRSGSLSTKAPTKRPSPNPTPSVATTLSTKSPTKRSTPQPTRDPTPRPTEIARQISTKNPTRRPSPSPTPRPPTRRPTPNPTPPPTAWVFQPVGYYGKGGKGGGGKSNSGKGAVYYNYGKSEGKGGKGSATYYNYGKGGKGKGGKSSKKSSSSSSSSDSYDYYSYGKGKGGKGKGGKGSSKGSKRSGSYTYLSSHLGTDATEASGVAQDATVHHSTHTIMALLSLALVLMA